MPYKSYNSNAYFFSILTAIIVGAGTAFIGIKAVTFVAQAVSKEDEKPTPSLGIDYSANEEGHEDPSFISKFSRVFIYSAEEDTAAVIESSLDSILPSLGAKKITAPSYIVTNMDKNKVLLEKDADRLMPLASVTKLVTAVVAKRVLEQDREIIISSTFLSTEGNSGRLKKGEKLKVKEFFYPLLMVSSNDAAEALARTYGRKEFVMEMNEWAASIGAYRTYFKDPSGLSPQNVSTARDISIIADWIRKNEPNIFDITLLQSKTVRTHTWINPTHFLNLSSYEGGKNGYIPEAKLTNVSLFSIGNPKKMYSVVLLGSSGRDADTLDALREAIQ